MSLALIWDLIFDTDLVSLEINVSLDLYGCPKGTKFIKGDIFDVQRVCILTRIKFYDRIYTWMLIDQSEPNIQHV